MSGLLGLGLVILWGFALGYMVGSDRRDRRENPYRFTWTCPSCSGWIKVSVPKIEDIEGAEAMARRAHDCADR